MEPFLVKAKIIKKIYVYKTYVYVNSIIYDIKPDIVLLTIQVQLYLLGTSKVSFSSSLPPRGKH